MLYNSIRPGQIWLDTKGEPIHAHGGSIFCEKGIFYWYGENKEHAAPDSGIFHHGMRCYSSYDLYNWKDEGSFIPFSEDPASPLHPKSKAERPHIIFNDRTGKYICWIKVMKPNNEQTSTVMTADRFLGPYEIVKTNVRPLSMNAGDFDLVKAPDGKAYYYFERVHTELICADLTDDYTDVTGYYSTHFPLGTPPWVREAPAWFYRQGKHYLLTSGTTGYHPNPSEIAVADTFHGPWKILGNPHPDDTSLTSFGSQISSVFRHPQKKDLYIAIGDRWMWNLRDENQEAYDSGKMYQCAHKQFMQAFSDDPNVCKNIKWPTKRPDTRTSGYVWLPIRFEGDIPIICWEDEWHIDDFD